MGPARPEPSAQRQAIEALIHKHSSKKHSSKKQRLQGADSEPIYDFHYKIKAELTWRVKNHTDSAHDSFTVDSGYTGPILNQEKVRKLKIPVHLRQQGLQILDAAGVTITGAPRYYSRPLDINIGEHDETLSWEVSHLPEDVLRYLACYWLRTHNPDINWVFDTLRWGSD